jgi:hypothetical protein
VQVVPGLEYKTHTKKSNNTKIAVKEQVSRKHNIVHCVCVCMYVCMYVYIYKTTPIYNICFNFRDCNKVEAKLHKIKVRFLPKMLLIVNTEVITDQSNLPRRQPEHKEAFE